ncbi:MAG TPA: inorganic phosphate transporter [Halanaerobiales bacterium]|nr:inorganic phosphate transporter [Halanaerobiales bacterium]
MINALLFMSSGLFLGWSLGANDAANLFGTAVGTKMVKFKTAAIIISVFVIIGAVISGMGASHTLGALGRVNRLPGAFIVALAAALTVFWMTNWGLPVSTSQSIVGAIIGWNLFANMSTDLSVLSKIVSTWVLCPVLSAFFAALFFFILNKTIFKFKIHLLKLDHYTRIGLIIVGAFGAYSLGANNIANVMGVFTTSINLPPLSIGGLFTLTSTQQLFLLGGIAISVGVFTYSKRVMMTVGKNIYKISPIAALIVVLSSSTVLFLFASESLKMWLTSMGLPSFPLVPVSSSQAVVGAVIGIGLAKGGRNINLAVLRNIGLGWIITPITSAIISYISLFFMQNVFMMTVY